MVRHQLHMEKKKKKKRKDVHEHGYGFGLFHFFKIITTSIIQHQRMGLPGQFVRKFRHDLPDVVVLCDRDGNVWDVELKKATGEAWFLEGLQRFIEHHSISTGHFLVFGYDGNSKFHVLVFDMSGSEKLNQHHSENFDESNQGRQCRSHHDGKDNHERFGEDKQKESVEGPFTERRLQTLKSQENTGANQALKVIKPAHPFFTVTMRPTYVKRSYSFLPMAFVKKYMRNGLESITLEVSDGRRWLVRCLIRPHCKGAKLGLGWHQFAKDNDLKVGHVCVFELVKENVLKVHIHRGN